MSALRQLIWNQAENRPRALLRLGIHALAMIAGWYFFAIVLSSLRAGGGSGPLNLSSTLCMGLAATSATWLCATQVDRRQFVELGLVQTPRWWADFAAGVGIGAVLMAGIFVVELGANWVTIEGYYVRGTSPRQAPFALALLGPALTFILVGFYEELVSRGYHLRNLAEGLQEFGPLAGHGRTIVVLATLGSSAVFGLLHAGNDNATLLSTFNICLAGCMLAASLLWTGQLGLAIGLHLSWNFFQGNVFGFPVSGGDAGARLIALRQAGDPLLTGGDFGPEAGLIGIAAMLLGLGLQALWVRLTRGSLQLDVQLTGAR